MSGIVVKVGGSLFTRPNLPNELNAIRRRSEPLCSASMRVWIAGGGAAVDTLREIEAVNSPSEAAIHWAAVRIMDANAGLLAEWLPEAELTDDWEQLAEAASGDWVFAPAGFLDATEPRLPGVRLPIGWSVSSDSIAARVAECLGAGLVLLKSRGPDPGESWAESSACGYVDEHFPQAVQGIRFVEAISIELGKSQKK